MLLGDALDKGQTQAPSRNRIFVFTSAVERHKEMFQLLRGNNGTWIPYFQNGHVSLDGSAEPDLASAGTVLDGVAQEIEQRARDQVWIALERRQIRGNLGLYGDLGSLRQRLNYAAGLIHGIAHGETFPVQG